MRAPAGSDGAVTEALLSVENVSLSFGGIKALTDVSFDVRQGEIRAIIGPNGAGKTSMLNVVNGFYHPQEGSITFKGRTRTRMRPYEAARGGIARTFQNVALFRGMTTLDNIMAGRRSSISSRFRRSARLRSAGCPMACRSASSSAARLPWSPTCCCSTSRWPA
jgi:branched-chain amino acid transport system ATP-binding protein